MGHSADGAFTQILLDRGFGAAAVAITSAPTEGVAVVPLSQVRPTLPVLKNPADRHRAVGCDYGHFAKPTAPPPRSRCSPAGPT
ncbi:hypothetical protein [Streptomyces mirabilis]|uniref:hypothetical protein n=1 Tax=Streptomyces mirabilis TaxID=68239 RepID=UPI0036E91020